MTSRWPKKRWIRLLSVITIAYGGLWLMTACVGTPQVQRVVITRMAIPPSSVDVSHEIRLPGRPSVGNGTIPCHWCVSQAYGPFLVVTRSGVDRGPLNAEGCSSFHLWLLGAVVKIGDFSKWIS